VRLLIVDKVWGQRQKLRGWLVQGGYTAANVLECEDGVAALELLRQLDFSIDVVLCDWQDPRVDGAALARETRRLAGAAVDFIAHGNFDSKARERALSDGAADAIGLPIRPELLMQKLVALEKRRAQAKPASGPSNTARFRMLAIDAPSEKPAPLSADIWEALRRNARHAEIHAGTHVPVAPPGARLWWVERGTIGIRETRDGGAEATYRAGPEEFFAEAPFGGAAYRTFDAVAEVDSWLCSQDADTVRRVIAASPFLFYYLRNLSTLRLSLYSRTGHSAEKGLSGTVESLPVLDLFQVLHGARRTGVLRLDGREGMLFVQFVEGRIVHAEGLGLVGETIVDRAMSRDAGSFEFYVGPEIPGVRSVTVDTAGLIMRGAQRLARKAAR
jgi:CheY-like chemotaxis protein